MKSIITFVLAVMAMLLAVPAMAAEGIAHAPGFDLTSLGFLGFGGLIVNKESIGEVFRNLKASFNKAFDGAETTWNKIATEVPSSSKSNKYVWWSRFPKMRKWIGEKVSKALEAFTYTIENDDYEATVEVDRNDIEDDELGQYGMQAQEAGYSSAQWPDELVYEAVNGAFTNPCYDGQYFCDTDHPVGDSTASNKGTAALTIATLAAAQASYGAARTAMRNLKDDEGRPLGIRPNILLVPPALEDTGRALLTNDRLEDGKPNPYKGTAELVVGDWLTSDTAWFLLDTRRPIKPFVFQKRKAPVFVSQTDLASDAVFSLKKFKFGAEARGAAGYALWQLCYGSTGAG